MGMKSSATLAKHSSASVEHYTPHKIVESARALMGGIDLDPATCKQANDEIVHAPNYFTKEHDGLARSWSGRVWLNPPGGKIGNDSLAKLFWAKLVDEYLAGDVTQACFLGFNLEMLQTTQLGCARPILSFPFCVPSRRIAFLYVEPLEPGLFGAPGSLKIGGGPTHANVIVFLPPRGRSTEVAERISRLEWASADLERFEDCFRWLGQCCR